MCSRLTDFQMTLIVAERLGGQLSLVSDSKLSPVPRGGNPYFDGALKLLIVRRSLCIGWGRLYDPGAIRDVISLHDRDLTDVLDRLKKITHISWIVASIDDGLYLARIRDGVLHRCEERTWIGDRDGYERFQAAYLHPQAGRFEPELRLLASLQWVIERDPVDSVGGFHVRVRSTDAGFRYVADESHVGPEVMTGTVRRESTGTQLSLRAAVDPITTFTALCCPGTGSTFGACGYYVREASKGILWRHKMPWEPVDILAPDRSSFVSIALDKYGQEIV